MKRKIESYTIMVALYILFLGAMVFDEVLTGATLLFLAVVATILTIVEQKINN